MGEFLRRAVPNEQWQMILEFDGPEYRLFDTSILCEEKGWHRLAYPQNLKRFTVTPDSICWENDGVVGAKYLYRKSTPLPRSSLEYQVLRLSYKNQAPTPEHKLHHVYGVYLSRFSNKPFRICESIGGGIAERGGEQDFSIQALMLWLLWKQHFELSGCSWAVSLLESLVGEPDRLLDLLVSEACLRNGLPEDV
jgi:hypothetical protein